MKRRQLRLELVNPSLLEISSDSPRLGLGPDYERFVKTVQEMGIIQPILVRQIPGNRRQVVIGNRRAQAARDAGEDLVYVLNMGQVKDVDAALMRHVADTFSYFGLLDECRSLAQLHRQGKTSHSLAKTLGQSASWLQKKIAVGYFPERIHELIEDDINRSGEGAARWKIAFLRRLLPLREGEIPTAYSGPLDETVYDFAEVERAVKLAIKGEISSYLELEAYVERRRREIMEERFDQKLQTEVAAELAAAEEALEEAHRQRLEMVRSGLIEQYEAQVAELQSRLAELQERLSQMAAKAARRPEIISQLQEQLRKQLDGLAEERRRLKKLEEEAVSDFERRKDEWEKQAAAVLAEREAALETELERHRQDLEAHLRDYYQTQVAAYRLKAETTVSQAVANARQRMAELEQSLALITQPDFLKGLGWLGEAERAGLLASIVSLREALRRAEELIRRGEPVEIIDAS